MKGEESIRHWKVAPGSLEKAKLGVESLPGPAGPESIVVSGAAVSMLKLRGAGVGSRLPVIGQWVPSLLILATFDRLMQAEARPGAGMSALPNGVAESSADVARVGSTLGGNTGSARTPGL